MSTFYGETICSATLKSGEPCKNKAYFLSNGKFLCGMHSKKDSERKELPKDPNKGEKKEQIFKEMMERCKKIAAENKKKGKKGIVICSKLRMMKEPEYKEGFLCVFPNYKHQNRKDGFGCKSLSPKDMGPVKHGQPGLPIALTIENFHQGNKVFECEIDKNRKPLKRFYETREKMYQDPVPHRHKEEAKGKNIPVFSVWVDKQGNEHHLSYFESRQFYCTFYERMAKKLPDFKRLRKMIDDGFNLQIVGYDAYPVTKTVEEHYKDISRPFGHELVLYTLLTEKEENYPWRKFATFDF